jgi:uncharacterized protein
MKGVGFVSFVRDAKDYCYIVKVTDDCNLNCSYCYNRANELSFAERRMNSGTLEQTVSSLLEHNNAFANFVWHGGEPLLMGLDFFSDIVRIQASKKDIVISNFVQTNGTLLNDEWIDFFYRNDFKIGISLDGFHDLHALNRGTDGHDFDVIMENIQKLSKMKIPFSVLAVVTQNSLGNEERIFDFFSDSGIESFGFLPMNYGDKTDCLSAADFGRFLNRFFELWLNKGKLDLKIREFDEYLRGYLGAKQHLCHHCNVCEYYFTITPSGDVYPCDCFPQIPETQLGTVFNDIGESFAKAKQFLKGSECVPKACASCEHVQICNGGCKYHRWINQKDFSEPQYYCGSYRSLYAAMRKNLSL